MLRDKHNTHRMHDRALYSPHVPNGAEYRGFTKTPSLTLRLSLSLLSGGFWTLDFGLWVLGFGFWALDMHARAVAAVRMHAHSHLYMNTNVPE